jgi:hypothetical protein
MPSNLDVLTDANAKFEVERNADFLIFWAVLFFTCVVGIIELLQLFDPKAKQTEELLLLSLLYFGLLS